MLEARVDFALLKGILNSVEQGFLKNGHPCHHHPSAQEVAHSKKTRSHIFVTSPELLRSLTSVEIQEVFRDRHIVIPALRPSDTVFNRRSLSKLGNLMAPRDIQGKSPILC